MPVMDGITATRRIRELQKQEKLPRITIIALTGLTSAAARNEAQEAGMDMFITKPISFEQLRRVLTEVNMQEQENGTAPLTNGITSTMPVRERRWSSEKPVRATAYEVASS